MNKIGVARPPDSVLAKMPPEPIPVEMAREIAALAIAISREALHRAYALSEEVPFAERSEAQRDAAARGVQRVVQAMQLLGLIEV